VTVITTEAAKRPTANLKTIVMDNAYKVARDNFDYESYIEISPLEMSLIANDWGILICEEELRSAGAQQLLNYSSTERFDLIITEAGWGECFFGFIHKFGSPPVVATSGAGIIPWINLWTGNPDNPSYMPNYLVSYSSHMTFSERLYNFVINMITITSYQYSYIPKQEAIARKYFKEDLPSFQDIWKNFSIILVNTLVGLDDPRPLLPNVIPIGGMHVEKQPKPLPKVLIITL
jgi:glucuronosyltransferase